LGTPSLLFSHLSLNLYGTYDDLKKSFRVAEIPSKQNSVKPGSLLEVEITNSNLEWKSELSSTAFCKVSGIGAKWSETERFLRFDHLKCSTPSDHAITAFDSKLSIDLASDGIVTKNAERITSRPWRFEMDAIQVDYGVSTSSQFQEKGLDSAKKEPHKRSAVKSGAQLDPPSSQQPSVLARQTIGIPSRFSASRIKQILTNTDDSFQRIVKFIPIDTKVTSSRLTLRLKTDLQKLDLGPWRLLVERKSDLISLVLSQSNDTGSPTSRLDFNLWPERHRSEFVTSIGPIGLKQLGVSNGDFGIESVERANVKLRTKVNFDSTSAGTLVETEGEVSQLSFRQPWLAKNVIRDLNVSWDGSITYEPSANRVHTDKLRILLGKVASHIQGEVEFEETRKQVRGSIGVPLAACHDFFSALPDGFAPLLTNWDVDGTFGISIHIDYDSKLPDRSLVKLKLDNKCRIRSVPGIVNPNKFQGPFALDVEDEQGAPQSMSFGPGTWNWVPLSEISPYVESAVLVCEDGRFLKHNGFDVEAIQNSIRENIKTGRFARGGSTVSMQLAKNLYLRRDKTLSRKLQEAALTMLLEQNFGKRQLLELYLNIIEYGPGIYGIGPAAKFYFNTTPERLTLAQSYYLISLLPNPKINYFGANGSVSTSHLRQIRWLMQIAAKRGHISPSELEIGLNEQLTFKVPGNPTNITFKRITDDLASEDKPFDVPIFEE
jgi:hypothetical protein